MSLGNQDGVPLEKLDPLMSVSSTLHVHVAATCMYMYTTCTPSNYTTCSKQVVHVQCT